MGLFLPVLLLGLAQSPDLPTSTTAAQPEAPAQSSTGSESIGPHTFTLDGAARERTNHPFDRIIRGNPPEGLPTVCLTMRSYYFERRDSLAPEFVGMTTCDPGRNFTTKKTGGSARLVPAK